MQYILLIYNNEAERTGRSQSEHEKVFAEHQQFNGEITKSGHKLGGQPLEASTTATTVRVKNGKILRTDGPFAETREQLAGFYLVEAKDLDEAVSLAVRVPDARFGSVEVRPIMKMPGM